MLVSMLAVTHSSLRRGRECELWASDEASVGSVRASRELKWRGLCRTLPRWVLNLAMAFRKDLVQAKDVDHVFFGGWDNASESTSPND